MPESHVDPWRKGVWATWGTFALTCAVYGTFAIAAGLGLAETGKVRVLPLAFEIHALTGGITLLTGIMQFSPAIRNRLGQTHRWIGRVYVLNACLASVAAVANAAFFDIIWTARLSFALLGIYWFLATVIGYRMIRQRKFTLHREWMLRSFALSLFFVSFSIWVPVLAGTGGGKDAAYTVAVTLSWTLNLLAAEAWVRLTRAKSNHAAGRDQSRRRD